MTPTEVLKLVGYPEQVLIIDFETFFDADYSLTKMSTIEYICDNRFDFTGCGFNILNWEHHYSEEAYFIAKPLNDYIKTLQELFGKNLEQVTVVAKNCKFDITILAVKFGIIPPFIIDIDDLLRHYDSRMSHRMKDVTKLFGLKPKGKTVQFKGLHYEDMSSTQREALAEYGKGDIKIEKDLFEILLPLLSNPSVELPVARHTLGLYLTPRFAFDFKKADFLTASMTVEMMDASDGTECTNKELSGSISFVKLLQDALPEGETVPTKLGKPTKNMITLLGQGRIPAFAKDDTGFQDMFIHPDEKVRKLCKARQAIKSWPLHIKRVRNMANQARVSGGLLRVPLHYYGAHTGRWSGGEKINLQNLGGRGRAGSGTHPLISAMRSLMGTPDGYTLGITDSAQIEARMLAWFADQKDLVDGFSRSEDIYSAFATELFQTEVRKAKENDPPDVSKVLTIKRGFGKDAILGCGYGMGAKKFYERCLANEDLRPLFDSGEYIFAFIERLVKTYRVNYCMIPGFWTDVEKAFKFVTKWPHEHAQVSKVYDENDNAAGFRLFFYNKKGTVHLRLPSGRELTYRHCGIKQTTKGSEIRWQHGHLWGGSITENIVQAAARDLLAYWILEMEKHRHHIIHHSHDETVAIVPEANATDDLRSMVEIMCNGPDWARGLPLGVDDCLSKVYKK